MNIVSWPTSTVTFLFDINLIWILHFIQISNIFCISRFMCDWTDNAAGNKIEYLHMLTWSILLTKLKKKGYILIKNFQFILVNSFMYFPLHIVPETCRKYRIFWVKILLFLYYHVFQDLNQGLKFKHYNKQMFKAWTFNA